MSLSPVYNPVVPYVSPIQTQLTPGTLIRIQGCPHSSSRCFAINLQLGHNVNPRDDIALHLSPVFSPPPRVVRNSLQAQRWGPEESFGGFPFVSGQGFEILILIEHECYKIAINGQHFAEFIHRLPYQRVSHLAIDGDVAISLIGFEPGSGAYAAAPPPLGLAPPPYPTGVPSYPSSAYPTQPGAYPPQTGVYPPQAGGYPPQTSAYPPQTGAYPTQSYPQAGYPQGGYPQPSQSKSGGILGPLAGLATGAGLGAGLGAATSSIGSTLFGSHHGGHHKHGSSPIPIGKIAAGAGAAALGAAVLTGHHPFKKAKKLFKHKHFKPKMFKHKGWKHKGWSSSGSSS